MLQSTTAPVEHLRDERVRKAQGRDLPHCNPKPDDAGDGREEEGRRRVRAPGGRIEDDREARRGDADGEGDRRDDNRLRLRALLRLEGLNARGGELIRRVGAGEPSEG